MSNTKELPEVQVFKVVFFHCVVIIVMPVLSFFASKLVLFDALLGLNTVPSNIWSAVVAIVVLHVALGAFIWRAYFSTETKIPDKTD